VVVKAVVRVKVEVPRKVNNNRGEKMKELFDRANRAIANSKGECFCEEEEAKKLTTKDRKKLKSSSYCG
jgi:hypothetical protein